MLKPKQRYLLFVISTVLVVLAGVLIRVGHLLFIPPDAPFRLGGLYLEFTNQIIQNHFLLPENIPFYSQNGLPFAYPPLGFYIQAILITLFHPAKFLTVNLIPPIVAALSVPSFYYLARQSASDEAEILISLAAFAFLPNAFLNQIEAAGLSEAFGTVALIWYAALLIIGTRRPSIKYQLLAGLLLALCVLSSPGSAVAASMISILFALWAVAQAIQARSVKLIVPMLVIGGLGVLLSAPYWLSVIIHHGKGIFLVTLLAQFRDVQNQTSSLGQPLTNLLKFDIGGGNFSFVWNVLTLLGLLASLTGSSVAIGIAFLLFVFIPREGVWISAIAASLLVGKGFSRFLLPILKTRLESLPKIRARVVGAILTLVFLGVITFNTVDSLVLLVRDQQWVITPQQVVELEQYGPLIPDQAKVIVLGNEALREWAPQLLRREVLNTEYGLEWQPNELELVRYVNADLKTAQTMDDILAVGKYFELQDFYLVTSDKARLSRIIENSHSESSMIEMLIDGKAINIVHIAGN